MYDAKKLDNKNEEQNKLKHDVVGERNYFNKAQSETFINNKVSYVPTENIFY